MSLMTAVLSKGKTDLVFFGLVFGISMLAFSNMFYVQLGPVMEDYNDQLASFLSLARALFGDFDIDDIMNNSRGYLNAILYLCYLFVAVFIMLSMFLAILGESQAAVRGDQDDEKKNNPDLPPEYGIFTYMGEYAGKAGRKVGAMLGKGKKEGEEGEAEGEVDAGVDPNSLEGQLGEMVGQIDEVQTLVGDLAIQVEAARSRPAGGAGADARALYKVVARVEETLSDKFVQLEERIARAQAKAKARKLAEAAAAGAAAPAEGGGAGAAGAPAGQPQHRPTRTLDPDATAAAPPPGGNASLASMLSDPPQTVEC